MDGLENDDSATISLAEEKDLGFLRSDRVTTPDNITLSEELSRLSSSPSQSQSSSCTSITNPFYDGPANPAALTSFPAAPSAPRASTSSSSTIVNSSGGGGGDLSRPIPPRPSGAGANTWGERRASRGSRRLSSHPQPCPEEEQHQGRGSSVQQEARVQQRIILLWNLGYLATCGGFIHLLQVAMTIATLSCLTSAGAKEGGLLNLPLSWHFRIMIFVLVLTLLVTSATLAGRITSLIALLGMEWICFDMIVYSLFAFLYLVGSSLVASAFDFYQKMKTDVSKETINQLVTSVILGYICMLLNGITAFLSYRRWKIQYRLYQRRKLIEEDEIDL